MIEPAAEPSRKATTLEVAALGVGAAVVLFMLTYERGREADVATTARIATCEQIAPPYPEGSDCEFFARVKAQIDKPAVR